MDTKKKTISFALLFPLVSFFVLGLIFGIRWLWPEEVVEILTPLGVHRPEIIGFQPYWLVNAGKQSYSNDVTTLAYFSLALEPDGTIRKYDNPGEFEPGWAKLHTDTFTATLSAHRKKGTKLSLLVQNMDEDEILTLLEEPEVHGAKLVEEVAPVMREKGFTDLNLDIESFTDTSEATRSSYVQFVRTVKDELTRQNLGTLTVELTPKAAIALQLSDVARIGEIADSLVLMAYDFHYMYSPLAGPVAPIGGVPTVAEYDVETALKETLRYAPKEKVILGIPLYGYEWETLRATPGSPVIPGSYQVSSAKKVADLVSQCKDCSQSFDPVFQEPSIVYPGEMTGHYQQIFYENKKALEAKIALAEKYQLRGVAVWALGYETEDMMAPLSMYKKTVQTQWFGKKSDIDYAQVQPATYHLIPPTHALVGTIATMSGEVKKMAREDEEYQLLETTGLMLQGEALATGEDGTATVALPNALTLTLDPWSELGFASLLSPNFFLNQKAGTVTYRLENGEVPWSVRVLHTLVQLDKGEMSIEITGTKATVSVISGSLKIGAIDADNVTTTFSLSGDQTAIINGYTKTVTVRE